MEHLQRVWLASRERLPFRTPGSVPILGLANAPIVETKFLELAMSLLDFSPRIPLGTFSILLHQLEHKQVPKRGTEPGVRKGKRSLLASHTRCKCSMETTRNSVMVKPGIKVMKIGGKSVRLSQPTIMKICYSIL